MGILLGKPFHVFCHQAPHSVNFLLMNPLPIPIQVYLDSLPAANRAGYAIPAPTDPRFDAWVQTVVPGRVKTLVAISGESV
jgi:hypothetical protein